MKQALLLCVIATGCRLADVEVDVEEVRLTYQNVEIIGARGIGAAKQSFVFAELEPIQDLVDYGATVSFVGAEMRATSGIDDLGFVEATSITFGSGDPMSKLPHVVAYDCAGNCQAHGRALVMASEHKHEANDYVRSGSILLDVDLIGAMPGQTWTMDLDVVLEARIDKTFDP
jgi:hypothetical protein